MVVAGLIAVALIGAGWIQPGSSLPTASRLPAPERPLWKPEPRLLIDNPALGLTDTQRGKIEALDRRWKAERSRLVEAMRSFEPTRGAEAQIRDHLEGYSELSRRYDRERDGAWQEALAVLTPTQRAKVGGAS